MMFSGMFAIAAVVIAENVVRVSGCTCLATTNQQIYCKSDWVSLVKILHKEILGESLDDLLMYNVSHIHIFKPKHNNTLPTTVMTYANSGICGVDSLDEGGFYLLAGYYDQEHGYLFIDICGQFENGGDREYVHIKKDLKDFILRDKINCKEEEEIILI